MVGKEAYETRRREGQHATRFGRPDRRAHGKYVVIAECRAVVIGTQIIAQRDRVFAQAQEEAQRTIKLAKEKGEDIIARDAIVEAAQDRADQIIAQARIEVEQIRLEADDYIIETLGSLESELSRLINQARNGIAKLTAERQGFAGEFEDSTEEEESVEDG